MEQRTETTTERTHSCGHPVPYWNIGLFVTEQLCRQCSDDEWRAERAAEEAAKTDEQRAAEAAYRRNKDQMERKQHRDYQESFGGSVDEKIEAHIRHVETQERLAAKQYDEVDQYADM